MNNPENSFHTVDTSTLYSYSNHTNIPWNVREYRTPKCQLDASLQIQKRKWAAQKKGIKDGRYVTKRGFYMDYALKIARQIPSPQSHGAQNPWDFTKLKKSGSQQKVDPKLSKSTYLQKIELQQKNRKVPGVGFYSIQKSVKQKIADVEKYKKQTIKPTEKIFFYQNTESLSNSIPGSGNYSPHQPASPHRIDNNDHNFWIKKHLQESQKFLKRQSKKPAPGTHSPMNTSFMTFDQLATSLSQPKKRHYFGLDAKFEYTRTSKKSIIQKRPDPTVHSEILQWKGKNSPKKTLLSEKIWKGHSQSIYR